jgi:putative ABC transport system ATP-binding protein
MDTCNRLEYKVASSPSATIVQAEDLHRHFEVGGQTVRALDGVDLAVRRGEFLAMMGPSGSGKSTLLYLLGGLDRPTEGRIWVQDGSETPVVELGAMEEDALAAYRRQRIGFVFQSFHLIPTMTALQNVEFPMIFGHALARRPATARSRRATRCEYATDLLERVGLADRLHHRPTELSGGQQQRVAIARALANDPALILADEPTGNLDSRTGQEIMGLLSDLCRRERRTVVIVSHDPSVTDYATRTVHLLDGRIVEERTRSDL